MNRFSRNYRSIQDINLPPPVYTDQDSTLMKPNSLLSSYRQSRSHRGRKEEPAPRRKYSSQILRISPQTPLVYTPTPNNINAVAEELLDEDVLIPVVEEEVARCLWKLIFESSKEMSVDTYETLLMKKHELSIPITVKEKLHPRILENPNWMDPYSEESVLSAYSWNKLVFNYRMNLEQYSFRTNGAIKLLKEQIFRQIAIDEVFKEVLTMTEEFDDEISEHEKTSKKTSYRL